MFSATIDTDGSAAPEIELPPPPWNDEPDPEAVSYITSSNPGLVASVDVHAKSIMLLIVLAGKLVLIPDSVDCHLSSRGSCYYTDSKSRSSKVVRSLSKRRI